MTENRQGYLKVYIMHRQNPSGFYIHPMQLRERSSATFIEKKKGVCPEKNESGNFWIKDTTHQRGKGV